MLNTWFYAGIGLFVIAVFIFFTLDKQKAGLVILLLAIFCISMFVIHLDPFLNTWDESFHALVAKNTAVHFLKPTLIESPLFQIKEYGWYNTNVWLHKQPLFLWQMAASINFFGNNLFAVRFPSVVLLVLLVMVVYDTARILYTNHDIAFIAACFVGLYEPILQLVSGNGMDHNNVSFIFYVTTSIWAWLKYEKTQQIRYIFLMGIFAGCAILNKWLTGLLVFLGMGIYHLFFVKDFYSKKNWLLLLYSIGSCLLIVLPWQIYILTYYPTEAIFEYQYNSRHFSETLEGHWHEQWFYFNILKNQYKYLHLLFIPMAIVIFLKRKKDSLSFVLLILVLFVYLFFTIAKTKLSEYVLIVAPILLILLANFIFSILSLIQNNKTQKTALAFCTIVVCYLLFDFHAICENHSDSIQWIANYRKEKKELMQKIGVIKNNYNAENFVIVNAGSYNHLDIMYFCNCHAINYSSEADIIALQKRNFTVIDYRDIKTCN